MKKKTDNLKEKEKLLFRLEKLGYAKILCTVYKPSRIELNILRWFNTHPAQKIADRLKINRSYVYAVIKKFEKIFTLEELNKQREK